jgi:DNA polymerase-3 subunit epsilon
VDDPFVAIDFETADPGRDSACAVGLVRVEGGRIVRQEARLIRPPRDQFVFSSIHGITWDDVVDQPPFGEVWAGLAEVVTGARFLAAHNAPFDRAVLRSCCQAAGIEPPELPFQCTVRLARRRWGIRPTTLPNVCRWLNIDLEHHDALSDARACAEILLASEEPLF